MNYKTTLSSILLLALSLGGASAAVMIDFTGTGGDAGPTASATGITDNGGFALDDVIAKTEVDANGGAFNVTVGSETLTVDLVDDDGSFIARDRGTGGFTDDTTGTVLNPFWQDALLASDDDMDVTIGGLTLGNQYSFYFHIIDPDYDANTPSTVTGDASFGEIGSVTYETRSETIVSFNDFAITTGTFTADAVSETFTIARGSAQPRGTLQALTLVAIPEPGSFALLAGALGLGLVMLRRRR